VSTSRSVTTSRIRATQGGDSVRLKPAQHAAAEQAWRAAAGLLESGAQAADLVARAELLRAVHSCRAASLPRLSSAGLRAAQHVRDLHERQPEFRLASLSWDVFQVLRTAHVLRGAETVAARWIGEARRGYARIGSLRLAGVFTEPVVSGSGYAGVVTYLADESGQLWSLGDVAPGDAHRTQFAYVTPLELGELEIEHRWLGRGGLALEGATAAANRRLGMGRGLAASDVDGVGFDEAPLRGLFQRPLREQLDRAWAARGEDERHAGDDLLFARCSVFGASRDALLLQTDDSQVVLHATAPSGHAELAYRRNLQLLARAPGLGLWVIGRIVYGRPRTLALLAIGSSELRVPSEWGGRVNLGLDRLVPQHLPVGASGGTALATEAEPAGVDPLDALERRLQQVLLAGRSAASSAAASGFARDEAALRRDQLATGAELLARLRQSERGGFGKAWLAARLYLAAASATLQREAWLS